MKLRSTLLLSSLVASVLLSSCATKFTAAQRAQLSTVAVSRTSVDSEAYEEPYGGDQAAKNVGNSMGGFGAMGVLVGAAVGNSIAATQNNMSKGENGHHFAAVQKNTPKTLSTQLESKLQETLKSDHFFSSRVKSVSENTLTSEISCYRLARIGKDDQGRLLFAPEVYTTIQLKDKTGKSLVGRQYIGKSTQGYTIDQFAGSSEKTKKAYDDALNNAVSAFQADLAIKTGE